MVTHVRRTTPKRIIRGNDDDREDEEMTATKIEEDRRELRTNEGEEGGAGGVLVEEGGGREGREEGGGREWVDKRKCADCTLRPCNRYCSVLEHQLLPITPQFGWRSNEANVVCLSSLSSRDTMLSGRVQFM